MPKVGKRWSRLSAVTGGAVLGLSVLRAAGAFRSTHQEGDLILGNGPENADVLVDDIPVAIARNGDRVGVPALKEGKHRVKIVLGGVEDLSSEVTIGIGRTPARTGLMLGRTAAESASATGDASEPYGHRHNVADTTVEHNQAKTEDFTPTSREPR